MSRRYCRVMARDRILHGPFGLPPEVDVAVERAQVLERVQPPGWNEQQIARPEPGRERSRRGEFGEPPEIRSGYVDLAAVERRVAATEREQRHLRYLVRSQ